MLKNEGSGSDGSCIIFAPIAMLPMDFEANCADLVGRGNTIFHQVRMVNLCLEDGYLDLRDNTLKICEQGRITEREFPEKEFPQILQEKFGITLQR